jgi:hypothetical protein
VEQDRDAAVRAAYVQAKKNLRPGGFSEEAARQVADEAGRRFESSTPVPLWDGRNVSGSIRRYTDNPASGLLSRTARRVIRSGAR